MVLKVRTDANDDCARPLFSLFHQNFLVVPEIDALLGGFLVQASTAEVVPEVCLPLIFDANNACAGDGYRYRVEDEIAAHNTAAEIIGDVQFDDVVARRQGKGK